MHFSLAVLLVCKALPVDLPTAGFNLVIRSQLKEPSNGLYSALICLGHNLGSPLVYCLPPPLEYKLHEDRSLSDLLPRYSQWQNSAWQWLRK